MDRLMDIAALAGSRIMEIYSGSCAVDSKDDGSPLTAADRAAHECIQRELMPWTPDMPVCCCQCSDELNRVEERSYARHTLRRFNPWRSTNLGSS
jgi:3'(2'), 5'-bisphosphate nucleotidase